MTSTINPFIARGLSAAGLAFGIATAQAASGFAITQEEETRISVGMSALEVEQNLGRPAQVREYRNKPGPTWIYEVLGATFGMTDFDVDFGPDGKVTSVSERVLGSH